MRRHELKPLADETPIETSNYGIPAPQFLLVPIPHSRARHHIFGRLRRPLVVVDAWVSGLIDARDLDERSGHATTVPRYLQAGCTRCKTVLDSYDPFVQADVLDSDKIVSRRGLWWDSELQAILSVGAPVAVVAGVLAAEADLVDLEPVAGAVVVLDIRSRWEPATFKRNLDPDVRYPRC